MVTLPIKRAISVSAAGPLHHTGGVQCLRCRTEAWLRQPKALARKVWVREGGLVEGERPATPGGGAGVLVPWPWLLPVVLGLLPAILGLPPPFDFGFAHCH